MATKVPGADVVRVRLAVGAAVPPGAEAPGGLYAVVKAKSGWPLRVTAFKELADHWRHPTRAVRECSLEFLKTKDPTCPHPPSPAASSPASS